MKRQHFPQNVILVFAVMLAQIPPAKTEIVVGSGSAFRNQVNACLELFSNADSETKAIVDRLLEPGPSPRHTIQQGAVGAGNLAQTTATNSGQAGVQPGGSNGQGSGSTVTMGLGIPIAQFCAILLHELKHAFDFSNGADKKTQPPRPQPGAGIPDAEIDAMREENRYRRHAGLPQVHNYGGIPLPADAVFN